MGEKGVAVAEMCDTDPFRAAGSLRFKVLIKVCLFFLKGTPLFKGFLWPFPQTHI